MQDRILLILGTQQVFSHHISGIHQEYLAYQKQTQLLLLHHTLLIATFLARHNTLATGNSASVFTLEHSYIQTYSCHEVQVFFLAYTKKVGSQHHI